MLIVCPSCATSYMLDPATLGPAGRTVRCARCKATWFAGGPQDAAPNAPTTEAKAEPGISAFADSVTAEAEATESPQRPAADVGDSGRDFDDENGGALPRDGEPAAEEHEPPQTISDAPSLVPLIDHAEMAEAETAAGPSDSEDVESFAARRLRMRSRRKKARRSSRWTVVALLLFAFNAALIGARDEIVRYLPQTASLFAAIGLPVNLRHLDFKNVRITREENGGDTILVVKGSIVSTASEPVKVPRLRFAARNKAGQEIYTWTLKPDRSVLMPGKRLDFRSTVASPPKDAYDVLVRFFTPNDATAGGD